MLFRSILKSSVCALVSGGLDSCALLAHLAKSYRQVYPLFIRQGYIWEAAEQRALRRFLRKAGIPHQPVTVLDAPIATIWKTHWAVTGRRVPGSRTRDEAVYLPGRNLTLLSLAASLCERHKIPAIALGSLGHNPFPDASPQFFRDFSKLSGIKVIAPFRELSKTQVVQRYRHLPLHLSLSCLRPRGDRPCGHCNKCAERIGAFRAADR